MTRDPASGRGLTRRGLIGGAAAASAAAAVPAATAPSAAGRAVRRSVDVAVVGAGLAGLTAARNLERAGHSTVVIEAKKHVGGRTENRSIGGGEVTEAKGEFVGPTQDRVVALAKKLGIGTFKTYNEGDNIASFDGVLRRYPATETFPPGIDFVPEFLAGLLKLDTLAAGVSRHSPWESPNAAELDRLTLEDYKRANFSSDNSRQVFDTAVNAIWAADPAELSQLYAGWYIAGAGNEDNPGTVVRLVSTAGGSQESRFFGGSQLISIRMAKDLDVALRSPVRRISQEGGNVIVESDELTVRARRAIVAVPPVVVGSIDFDPDLPAERAQLVQRFPPGTLIKAEAVYDRPFWRDAGLSGQVVTDAGPMRSTFDSSPPDGRPGVMFGFIAAHDARVFQRMSKSARRATVLEQFAEWFGDRARSPRDYFEATTAGDPFTGGCPVGLMAPGTMTDLGPSIRKPFKRVHWAGSETATFWQGYMDGAVRSGERVAEEVAERL